MADIKLQSIRFPGLSDTYTVPDVDDTLSVSGATADAKKTGDEISDLKDSRGTLTNLTTTAKSSLVAAVNEVDAHADTNATAIGTLASLTTTAKSNLVAAVNEVDAHADTNATNISTLNNQLNALGLSVVDGALNITYTEE